MHVDLQQGEHIVTMFRRHWILFAVEVFGLIVLFFVPIVFSPFLPKAVTSNGAVTFFIAIWMLMLWMRLFVVWFKYYFDVWVITNQRIIDIEQISLFNRKASTLDPEHIEDITIHIEGIIKSMLGFGDLTVQTAGHVQEFIMVGIKNPDNAKQAIYETMQMAKRENQKSLAEHINAKAEPMFVGDKATQAPPQPMYIPTEQNSQDEHQEGNHILSYYSNNH